MTQDLVEFIKQNYPCSCGIIYCLTRNECEKLSETLNGTFNLKTDFYHADMNDNTRKLVQHRWMTGEINIVIATIAFGMGINKKDVRFVVHFTMPKSLENYA